MAGIAGGYDVNRAVEFIQKGAQWIALGCDFSFMLETADRLSADIRARLTSTTPGASAT